MQVGMVTTPHPQTAGTILRNPFAPSDLATQAENNIGARSLAFGIGALLAPLTLGAGIGGLLRSRRAAVVAGGAVAAAFGFIRWQLQRWFTNEPAYTIEHALGALEIRHYEPRVEAHTRFATLEFDDVRERGFRRLAHYIFGGNAAHYKLAMTTPVTIAPRAGSHTMAFVMPPGFSRTNLPHPDDSRIELVEIPARRVAVLRYRGGYSAATVEKRARQLRELVAAAGLTARGEPMFAGCDPPSTLPFLRRTEIWIELA
jgi:hypothetical protein